MKLFKWKNLFFCFFFLFKHVKLFTKILVLNIILFYRLISLAETINNSPKTLCDTNNYHHKRRRSNYMSKKRNLYRRTYHHIYLTTCTLYIDRWTLVIDWPHGFILYTKVKENYCKEELLIQFGCHLIQLHEQELILKSTTLKLHNINHKKLC